MEKSDPPMENLKDINLDINSNNRPLLDNKSSLRKEIEENFQNRWNFLKLCIIGYLFFAIITVSAIAICNIMNGSMKLNFSGVDWKFTDIVSLSLALCAIILTVYLSVKASEASSHICELLVRFDDRLNNIESCQQNLQKSVQNVDKKLPIDHQPSELKRNEMARIEKKIEDEIAARELLFKNLIQKAPRERRKEYLNEFHTIQETINKREAQKKEFENKINLEMQKYWKPKATQHSQEDLIQYLRDVLEEFFNHTIDEIEQLSSDEIQRKFQENLGRFHPGFINEMRDNGYIDYGDVFTPKGITFINWMKKEIKKREKSVL